MNTIARDPERWIIPTALAATTSIVIGAVWDISWHMTVGRDTLWTLPHLLEQFGAAVAGIVCGAYVLWLTLMAPESARAHTVGFWGFRGPLGAWVIIWGALAMIVSVPFDNWWHGAYGLDVEILSPPHTVLMLGVLGIQIGTVLFALAAKNRAQATGGSATHARAFTFATGVLVLMGALGLYEEIGYANAWHRSVFYQITAILFPFIFVGVTRAAGRKWAATIAAGTYMGVMLITMWVLQLVPAEPKLAPIYNHVTHMVPLAFPLVLIVPALLIDIVQQRFGDRKPWLLASMFAVVFVVGMLLVHWPFGSFMLTPRARNFLFAADQWPYMYQLREWRHQFWGMDVDAAGRWSAGIFARGMALALVLGLLSARVGIAWGNFTRRLMR